MMSVSKCTVLWVYLDFCLVWEVRPYHCHLFCVLWCWSIQFQNKSAHFVMFSNLMILLLIFFRGHFLNDVIYTVSYLIRGIKCCYSHVWKKWSPPFFLSASKCSNFIFQQLPWIQLPLASILPQIQTKFVSWKGKPIMLCHSAIP